MFNKSNKKRPNEDEQEEDTFLDDPDNVLEDSARLRVPLMQMDTASRVGTLDAYLLADAKMRDMNRGSRPGWRFLSANQ
jgi:hypothetical protein